MGRFIEGEDRQQVALMPECLDDYIGEDNPVRVIDAFVGELDLIELGFEGANPAATGRPAYHPAALLKIYIYGYLNRIQSSRRLGRECQRNVELMWLTGRLAPDFKTIADFRRDNGKGIRNVCRRFVVLCRDLKLFSQAMVAIDGSKFKAVPTAATATSRRPRSTSASSRSKRASSATSTRWRPPTARSLRNSRPRPSGCRTSSRRGQRAIYRFTREENGLQIRRYWSSACPQCPMKAQCTPSKYRKISRWEHEAVLEAMQRRLDRKLDAMMLRRRTVEHVFGTLKHWMGSTHFLMRRLPNVGTEMSLHVLAYNLKRVISILGIAKTMKAMKLVGA